MPFAKWFKRQIHGMIFEFLYRLRADHKLVSMIFIETITACNLRCSCCPNSIYDRGLVKNVKRMEPRLFYKIIDELAELKWRGEIQPHHCGEPLLDDRIVDFIAYAKKKIPGSTIKFYTNGELLNVSSYKKLIEAGVDGFVVTQHLPVQSKGVLEVLEHRNKFDTDNIKFDYSELGTIFNWGGEIEINGAAKKNRCDWPINNVGIDYAGNLLMCCWDYSNKVKIGNVNEERMIDIWNKPSYRKLRKEIKSGIFKLDICKKCLYKQKSIRA